MASRANHAVLLGSALLCAAALACANIPLVGATERQSQAQTPTSGETSGFPTASDARLAGDAKQTRFILDLDKAIAFRAFALADPYRVVVDIPQVNFALAAGSGNAGRGTDQGVPLRSGDARRLADRVDLTGPAKVSKSYVLDAANGQPPRLVLEFEEVDRTTFVQSLAAENRPQLRPAIADANDAVIPATVPAEPPKELPKELSKELSKPAVVDSRPLIIIDPGMAESITAPRPVAKVKRIWCWHLAWRCATASRRAASTAWS